MHAALENPAVVARLLDALREKSRGTRLLSWPPAPSPAAYRGRGLQIPGDYLGQWQQVAAAARVPRGSHAW
jgi:hypothetical protein